MADLLIELKKSLHCPVEQDKSLAPLTTLGVGGCAACFIEPTTPEDFQAVMQLHEREPFPLIILGGGSNIVIADGIISGVVLSTGRWNNIAWHEPEGEIHEIIAEVQTGYKLAALLNAAREKGLGGLEFAAGIPGSMGGAVAGNVGAGGKSVGELLLNVTTVEHDGTVKTWGTDEFSWNYRWFSLTSMADFSLTNSNSISQDVAIKPRVFLSCRLKFTPRPADEIASEIMRFRSMRAIQPVGLKSAGCTFKNPPKEISGGLSAGQLLDWCGCKGLERGDAVVSVQHANFILNRGHASAQDIFSLMRACQDCVLNTTGIQLEPEIKFLGF